MNSIDMVSALEQTTEKLCLESVTTSLQTSNQLDSHKTSDLSIINPEVPEDNQNLITQSFADKELINDTKILIECRLNYSIIEKPKGLFEDKQIRNGFIRKVYSILFFQILFTIIVSGIMFTFLKDWLNFDKIREREDGLAFATVITIYIGSTVALLVVIVIFCCSVSARRTVPTNYMLLGIYTLAMSLLVGIICVQNNGEHIIIAFVLTGVVVLAITLLATTPWFDITNCGFLLFILFVIYFVMGIIIFAIVLIANINVRLLYLGLSIFGAFLFSLYLLYDTQLILGGKKYQMSPEEYVFAAICLYIDIIQIFLNILGITQNID